MRLAVKSKVAEVRRKIVNLFTIMLILWSMRRTASHLVEVRPWPLFVGIISIRIVVNTVLFFRGRGSGVITFLRFLGIGLILGQWWRDVVREGTYLGYHGNLVVRGLKIGMVLFILSEVIFFFGFFWAFFHSRLAPRVELGCV